MENKITGIKPKRNKFAEIKKENAKLKKENKLLKEKDLPRKKAKSESFVMLQVSDLLESEPLGICYIATKEKDVDEYQDDYWEIELLEVSIFGIDILENLTEKHCQTLKEIIEKEC